jgi:hypothetical protein
MARVSGPNLWQKSRAKALNYGMARVSGPNLWQKSRAKALNYVTTHFVSIY